MKTNSLTAKLLAATTIALISTTALIVIVSDVLATHFPRVLLEADFSSNAETVADGLVFDAADVPIALRINSGLASVFKLLKHDALYRVVDKQGKVLLPANENAKALSPKGKAFDPALARFDLVREGNLLHVATFPLERPGSAYYIQIARSEFFQQALIENDSEERGIALLVATVFALLVFSGIVLYMFHRVLKPLHTAAQAAARITPGNRDTRLSNKGMPSELAPLITAFNEALERLSVGYHVQQEFLTTAAHELKTPLALMRGTVELGSSPERATLLADIDGMSRQVQQLLQLAECSESQNYIFGPTDAAAVATRAAEKLSRLASSRDVEIHATLPAGACMIHADGATLSILMRNLIDNALHHAPRGSKVHVVLSETSLSVRDFGPGISAQQLPMLFRRYWRGMKQDYSGSGLGLAICKEIAQVHGWTISAKAANPGACFLVHFHQSATDAHAPVLRHYAADGSAAAASWT